MSQAAALKKEFMAGTHTQIFATVRLDNQLLGISVKYVRDVLRQQKVTPVPLAPPEVMGALNLRGRIVTVIDLRRCLGLEPCKPDAKNIFMVVELKGELYSLVVDGVGEVLTVPSDMIEKTPANLTGCWKDIASGIYKLDGELLVLIDVQSLLTFK